VVTFLGGFIVAFAQGWLLTLVMMATIPPLVVAGAVMSNVVAKMASLGQAAYAESSVVVEQTIGSIRTVSITSSKVIDEKEHTNRHRIVVPLSYS
jgi:ATP-binding cassette subfamily B (MDR/TAP) protein 1